MFKLRKTLRTSDSKHRDISAASKQMELFGSPIGLDLPNHTSETRLTGSNPIMLHLDEEITRLAHSDHPVLITGESGTGKTTFAQIIHQRSPRATSCLVDINCAALPDTLIESELFGFEKGAFTGAMGRKKVSSKSRRREPCFLTKSGNSNMNSKPNFSRQSINRKSGGLEARKTFIATFGSSQPLLATFSEW